MSEHDEQVELFEWAAHRLPVYPELALMFAIPNGGMRNIVVATKLKAEGVKSGVPDIILPVARGKYHSLYIEMKFGRNKPTQEQKEWMQLLSGQGNLVSLAYSFEDARTAIIEYLDAR